MAKQAKIEGMQHIISNFHLKPKSVLQFHKKNLMASYINQILYQN